MLVDAHVHVWPTMQSYPNPGSTIVSPPSDVPLELLSQYMEEHGVDRAVLVQPIYLGEDNTYIADCAAQQPDRFAAVCVINPWKPGAPDQLQYWVQAQCCKGLRLRPHLPHESSIFGDPATFPLWERASALNVVISILASLEHVPTLASLAERFPEINIVIDHMAHPDVLAGVKSKAFQRLLDMARYQRVFVKVSGYFHYSRQPYPYADSWDFFSALYDSFGPTQLIWGSDFPNVLLRSGYRRALLLQERAYPFLSSTDLTLIMGRNAARLYW